jgi:phosphoribosyl 1,2-cyclic phosphodiesterase
VRLTIWGCRGSLASPGRQTVRYGGNTSCVEVQTDEGRLILDAGTGIRALGLALSNPAPRIDLLLTHLHLDHLEGLAFFLPLWQPETELRIWGPPSPTRSLEERIGRYFSPPLFPIDVADVPSRVEFHDVPEDPWVLAGVQVTAAPVAHPGPTLGYRFDSAGGSFAYIPDHEPALGTDLGTVEPEWIPGFDLASGVDLLLHDAQFTDDEYSERVGWGHSSVTHAVTFAQRAGVGRLVLFHHDPWHADGVLDEIEDRARELWNGTGEPPLLAREGLELKVEGVGRSLEKQSR